MASFFEIGVFIGGMQDLHFNVSDLNGYIDMLYSSDPWKGLNPAAETEAVFFDSCRKYLLSAANRISFLRCVTVRLFFYAIRKCLKKPVKVKLHPFLSGYGYMLDCGEIHILSDLLFRSTQACFISVLLHETAHIVLSQDDSYESLLKLDRMFAEKFFEGQHSELLKTITPVEFYAEAVADLWCRSLADSVSDEKLGKALTGESERMHKKLLDAIGMLKNIGQR